MKMNMLPRQKGYRTKPLIRRTHSYDIPQWFSVRSSKQQHQKHQGTCKRCSHGPRNCVLTSPQGDSDMQSLRTTHLCEYIWPLNKVGIRGADTLHKNPRVTFDSPGTELQLFPQYLWGAGSRTPSGHQNPRCSSPSYKMVENNAYSQPCLSADSWLWTENTVFDPRLNKFADGKPRGTKERLYSYFKKSAYM